MVKQVNKLKQIWYKNDDEKGGSMQEAINNCKDTEIVVHSQTKKDGRMWGSMTPTKFINLLTKNNGIYEVITKFPHKLYFDIDHHSSSDENFLPRVKELITEYFPNIELAISGSITPDKTSYHIIAQNYVIHDDKERTQIKMAVKSLQAKCDAFDWKVYTKNRNMKCINQSKDDGRVQEIIENQDMKAHCITCFVPTYSLPYNFPEEVKDEIMVQKAKGTFDVSILPKLVLEVPEDINISTVTPIQVLGLMPLDKTYDHSYTHRIMRFAYYNNISFEEFASWLQRKHDIIPIQKWTIHWNKAKDFPEVSMDSAINLLAHFYPNIKKDHSYRCFYDTFQIKLPTYIETITPLHYQKSEKFLVFNIGMGGGKTFQTIKHLKKKKFVWIAPNRALAHNTLNRLEDDKIPVVHYLQNNNKDKRSGCLVNDDNLIIVANSLHYLEHEGISKTTDVIVIDEIETLLQKWFGTFMENKEANWRVFLHLIRSAKQVILLDAFITKQTMDFIELIGGTNILYQRKNELTTRTINYLPDIPTMYSNIIEDLKQGMKLFIFYPHKNGSKKNEEAISMQGIYNMLIQETGKKGIFYNADIDDKVKLGLRDVNESWAEQDFIITNSIITCGVNYDNTKMRFDKEYIFICNFSSPRDVIQVTYRPRILTTNQINVCFVGKMIRPSTWEDDCYKMNCPIYSKVISGVKKELSSPLKKTFQLFCVKAYYKQVVDKKQLEKQLIVEINQMVSKYQLGSVYEGIEDISGSDEERLQQKLFAGEATMLEKYQLSKYHFKNQFDVDTGLEEAWNNQYMFLFRQLKKMILNDNSISKIHKEWGSFLLPKKPKLSDELKEQIFKEFTFKFLTPKSNPMLIVKEIFNSYFGLFVIYSTQDDSKHVSFHLNEDIDMNRWYEFIKNHSIDKCKWEEWDESLIDFS